MEENKFYIRIASPVHVGCDEVYDPTGFVLHEESGTLTAFEPMDFFRSLPPQDKSRYAAICSKGTIESILELYKFMRGKRFVGHDVRICKGLIAQYQKTLGIPVGDRKKIQQELNNFSISRTAFNPLTQKPYIPGSAIKGAFRTAYLNYLAKERNVHLDRRDRNFANALEKELLQYQSLEKDPFRLLKVSDFHPVGPCATKIAYAVNAKKTPSKFEARGPFQILEIIEPGAVFAGTIQTLNPLARDVIKAPLSKEKVLQSATIFYEREKKRENEELEIAGLPIFKPAENGDLIPLRLGRHSGAESLTVEGYRHIKIMKKRGERTDDADKATTFWLASDASDRKTAQILEPFGWAGLGRMTNALNDELTALAKIQEKEGEKTVSLSPAEPSIQSKNAVPPPHIEEVWENAFVSFNAGSGGVVTAQGPEKKTAEIRGKDKAISATDEGLRKKLFDGKKTLPKARVTVRKAGNAWEIVKIEPAG
ncbi:MAG TPA: type III-A CRISPR-associated RAMP protein Csm5 [Smithellaceae bacterium]|mgnify:CR=1 FL=1|nr:type III-A CRISPR-associated RAMP protein Csm5 [Smithellaceae bacterium]HRV43694.1 type III-A CRISPR-associated RAMP protein Csm5 [Smithellaceae bacterium]